MSSEEKRNHSETQFYSENGYLLADNVFTLEEVAQMKEALQEIYNKVSQQGETLNATWAGNWKKSPEFIGQTSDVQVKSVHNVQNHSAVFSRMLLHTTFCQTAAKLMPDGNVALHHTKVHTKPPGKGSPYPLHQDYPYFPHKLHSLVAAIIHLDDANEENGCMCLIPGSHKQGELETVTDEGYHYLNPEKYPISKATPVPAKSGSVLFVNYFTPHGSYLNKSTGSRTVLIVQLMSPSDTPLQNVHMSPGRGLLLWGVNPILPAAKRGYNQSAEQTQ